jgi:hypothetical protein
MRRYEVKLYFSGVHVEYVESPDEDEAYDVACDELANMHQLDDLEITDCEICEDGEDDEDDGQ